MSSEETNRILNEIGQLLAEDKVYPLDGTLLYAQVEAGKVSIAIFKNRDNSIVYRWPDLDHLGDALFDLWYAEKPKNRWAEVEYLVRGDTFEVVYVYANEIDPDEEHSIAAIKSSRVILAISRSSIHRCRRLTACRFTIYSETSALRGGGERRRTNTKGRGAPRCRGLLFPDTRGRGQATWAAATSSGSRST